MVLVSKGKAQYDRGLTLAFCVFDRPSVVAAYDGALAAVSDRGSDGDASERVDDRTDDIDSFLLSRVPKQKNKRA